jgi:ATP-dependent DNA helicase RecG
MKPEEKDKAMQLFVKGITQIMIATTVIEVGVNVPNASVMIIENAERFGLSQMHQLRGRVGRGADQSYCILMTPFKLSKEARLRINTMCATNDGFEISEVDMKMRGPGDMQGTQQSGIPMTLRMANLATDGDLVQLVRDAANEVLKSDPTLELFENQILQKQLKKHFRKPQNWETIS